MPWQVVFLWLHTYWNKMITPIILHKNFNMNLQFINCVTITKTFFYFPGLSKIMMIYYFHHGFQNQISNTRKETSLSPQKTKTKKWGVKLQSSEFYNILRYYPLKIIKRSRCYHFYIWSEDPKVKKSYQVFIKSVEGVSF